MHIGHAVALMRQGHRVSRAGWNGKGMFLFLVHGSTFKVNRPPLLGIYPEGTEIKYHPHVDMKTADGQIVPWLCSQSDLLADDWDLATDEAPVVEHFNGTDLCSVPRDMIGAAMHCVRKVAGSDSNTYKALHEIAFSPGTPASEFKTTARQEIGEVQTIGDDPDAPLSFSHDRDIDGFLAGHDPDL